MSRIFTSSLNSSHRLPIKLQGRKNRNYTAETGQNLDEVITMNITNKTGEHCLMPKMIPRGHSVWWGNEDSNEEISDTFTVYFFNGVWQGWGRLEAWKGYSSKLSIKDKGCENITVEEPWQLNSVWDTRLEGKKISIKPFIGLAGKQMVDWLKYQC